MLLAMVPEAPPTRKNQRATSCPAPISANVPYFVWSRLICSAFWCVLTFSFFILADVTGWMPRGETEIHRLPQAAVTLRRSGHSISLRAMSFHRFILPLLCLALAG